VVNFRAAKDNNILIFIKVIYLAKNITIFAENRISVHSGRNTLENGLKFGIFRTASTAVLHCQDSEIFILGYQGTSLAGYITFGIDISTQL